MTLRRFALLLLALLLALPAAAQVPPNAEWRTMDTEHFRIHFTPALEPLARRAAERAETARAALQEALVSAPRGKIDIVLSDNVDFSNGYATPLPTNRIVLYTHPPVDSPELAFYDDWLQLVVSHELVHIFHLDYAEGFPRALRKILGRNIFTFPNAGVPRWSTEGLATVLESRLTRAGRVRATQYDMMLRTAILEDHFFSYDRASGTPVSWPGGSTPYVYGSLFLDYMGERYGDDKHGEWVRRNSRRGLLIPSGDPARRAYGQSFSAAWREWRRSLTAEYTALADSLRREGLTETEVLVREGRNTESPRWSPDGRTIAFAQSTGREESSTRLWSEGRVRVLDARTSLGASAWRADGALITTMLDAVDRYHYFSDLYVVRPDGDRDRLTRGARVAEPDVHLATGRIVAVRGGGGTTVPVVMDADGSGIRELLPASPDVHWTRPRWSPDGTRIAIARWRVGALYDVVVLDAASGRVVREVTADRAVDTSPSWSPDGRYVIFSSDRTGIANLYAYDVAEGRLQRVTNVLTGAFDPDVSPDGRWIAFTEYHADGFHLARTPFDPSRWTAAPPLRPEVREPGASAEAIQRTAGGPARRYSAFPSILPSSWTPILDSEDGELGLSLGAAVGGTDVVGRHAYSAFAQLHPRELRTEGGVGYLFSGLGNPILGASAVQDWAGAGFVTPTDGGGQRSPTEILERERSASLVGTFTRPRFRSFSWLSLGVAARKRNYTFANGGEYREIPTEAGSAATLGYSTARRYDYSVSQENGFVVAGTVEGHRYLDEVGGADGGRGYLRTMGRAQQYLPFRAWGYSRHVVAMRVAGGADRGALTPGYTLGGIEGGVSASPLSTFVSTGGRVELPVRGYEDNVQFGDRAVAGSLEWRFPVALVERGIRTLYLDRLWGAAFLDGGRTWCSDDCLFRAQRTADRSETLASLGAEFGANVGFTFGSPIPVRAGVGIPLRSIRVTDGSGGILRQRPDPRAYLAFGLAF